MINQKNDTKKIAYNYLINSSVKGCFIVYCSEADFLISMAVSMAGCAINSATNSPNTITMVQSV